MNDFCDLCFGMDEKYFLVKILLNLLANPDYVKTIFLVKVAYI